MKLLKIKKLIRIKKINKNNVIMKKINIITD